MYEKMNNASENAYKNAFRKENYRSLSLLIRKDSDLLSRLETQKILTGKSFNSLIIEAIEEYLNRREM